MSQNIKKIANGFYIIAKTKIEIIKSFKMILEKQNQRKIMKNAKIEVINIFVNENQVSCGLVIKNKK